MAIPRREPIPLVTVHERIRYVDQSHLSRQWIRPHTATLKPRSGYAEPALVEELGPQRFYELCRTGVITYDHEEA